MSYSLHGIELDDRLLRELRRQCLHHNIFAIFLPNAFYDRNPKPVFNVLSKIVKSVTGQLECLNEVEFHTERQRLPKIIQMLLGEPPSPLDLEYRQRLAIYQVVWVIDEIYNHFEEAFAPLSSKSEVINVFPELLDHLDEEGLLLIGPEFKLHDGGIEYRDHILHYHQGLRRGFASNPNFDFTFKFASCYRELNSSVQFRIAIDPRRLMHKSNFQQMMEFDTWYGPAFDEARIDDPYFVGLTSIDRERPSPFDHSIKLERTEFYWTANRKTSIKSFEIEEISSEQIQHRPLWINRYVHAERDLQKRVFRHLDGAIKVYNSANSYSLRQLTKLPKEPRADKKPKLFRLDGEIPLNAWLDLTSMFFKGNEMVLRYFDSEKYEATFREHIRAYQMVRKNID